MPKNVIISEGGKGLRFADVSKLITDKSNGNDSWVPTEDRIIRQKYISENGIYYAKDDGIYGFSKLTVNIPGGAQGYTVPTVASLPYGVEVATTDPSQPMPIIPGTVGSSLIGIDPDTGLRSIATVQPDGTLKQSVIPSAIRILIKPAKLSYNAGDKIQYAGLVVELLDSDGNNFQDERFPQGIISWSPVKNLLYDWMNLITPLKEVDSGGAVPSEKIYITTTEQVHYASSQSSGGYPISHHIRGTSEHVRIVFNTLHQSYASDRLDDVAFFAFSDEAGQSVIEGSGTRTYTYPLTYQYKGYYTYYANGGPSMLNGVGWCSANPASLGLPHVSSLEQISADDALGYAFGGGDHKMDVPVQWKSPYDNQTYEDKFEIEVRDSEGASDEGGSSEGGSSEGGGGGHSF